MASITLAMAANLSQNQLVAGVIEEIITVNQSFQLVPFQGIDGNALAYNRELVLGGVGLTTVGDTLGTDDANPETGGTQEAKSAATFTPVNVGLTTLIGDAEVNGLIQATKSNYTDQAATQIASKAKNLGRLWQWMFINGDSDGTDQFDGLLNLVDADQTLSAGDNGAAMTFTHMDELMDTVTAKDGMVDFFMMHARQRRKYRALLRASGGASISEIYELPSGEKIDAYSGVPILRNDYIPITQSKGTSEVCTTVFAGCWDDGSQKVGIAGLNAANEFGIVIEPVGIHQSRDERIWRVKWYSALALFSTKALAAYNGINAS